MTPDDQERTRVDAAERLPEVAESLPEVGAPPVVARPGRRSVLRRVIRLGFLALALALGTWFVVSRWGEVRDALAQVSLPAFVGSCLVCIAAGYLPMLAWRRLLADLGSPLPVAPAARVYFLSQLGKYVPGSIWTVVAQVDLARELHVPPRRSAAAALLVLAISLLGGVLCAVITLPFAVPDLLARYWWVLLAVPALLALLHPRAVRWWSGLAARFTSRGGGAVELSYRALGVALGWTMLSWLLFGVHLYLLAPAVSEGGFTAFLLCAGLYGLAWTAGFLAVVVPAGAGIREAVLVLGLAPYLPAGGALVVALLSRVVATIVDVSLAGLGVLMARVWRRSTQAE